MKLWFHRAVIALVSAFLVMQLAGVTHTNPPIVSDLVAAPDVTAILRRSCYDCHSNETQWRWYAYVAPISWLITSDVEHARARLNFSNWGQYSSETRRAKADEMLDEIESADMPPKSYALVHRGVRPSALEIERLKQWAGADP
jgi:hypothetical protein